MHGTFQHIVDLLTTTAYLQWFANTLFVSVAATIVSVFVSYITAYAIIRLRFPGSEVVSTAIFLAYIVPPAILFIPLATMHHSSCTGSTSCGRSCRSTRRSWCRSAPGC